jgi:hypothetical protein
MDYVMSLGYNIYTQRGEEMVDFQTALYIFCRVRCDLGLGWQQYDPAPFPGGPLPPADNGNGGGGGAANAGNEANVPMAVPEDIVPHQAQGNNAPAVPPQEQIIIPAPVAPGPFVQAAMPPHLLGFNVGVVPPVPAPLQGNGADDNIDPDDIIVLDY